MKKFISFIFMLMLCLTAHSQTNYNSIATAYVTTTISQNVVFDSTMKAGGTFTFSALAHNGGGRAGEADTANVKIQFYTAGGALISTVNSNYSANLPLPTAQNPPRADPAVPWTTLTTSSVNCGGSCANVAYATISMYGIDASYWAGDYGPWYRAPTFQLNGGANLAYNPEFGPAYGYNAQGWTTNPGMGACQGAWGGSNPCIVNSSGTPGTSTTGLVANANGGGPSATGGTTSGQAGGYNSTMTTSNPNGPAPVVNYTTTAGTMPGGYIGRILNNTPGQTQTYTFTYTPTVTGSQYVQLAFRQDPAFWTVTGVGITASGSTTNLLTNGNFANGGTITAQTNNGPTSVNTPTNWGVAYQSGIYPGAAGSWSPGMWYDGAVGSFDAIYQGVTLTSGTTYTVTVIVSGDNTSDNNLDGAVQLGVYAGACDSLTLSPDQCTLPSTSGYTTLATPSEGASAGNAAPTITGTSTSNSVSTNTSVGTTTTTNNQYTWGGGTYTVTGTSTPTTTTTTTTPVTTTYWSDGSTTSSNGTSTTTSSVTYNYTVTKPNTAPVNPNAGTNINSVYITQTNAGSNNNITTNQSGHGNYESISLGGSNNTVRLGQGYTFSTTGVATESVAASNNNLIGLSLSGNTNTVTSTQVGDSNSSILSVTGNSNTLTLTQTNNSNQTYSTVSGSSNTLTIGQNGTGNIAAVNLYGNNNSATVTQTGNNHGTVLNLVNAGGANTVSVVQTGTGDAYSLQQTCTNPAGCSVSVIRNK